MISYDLDPSLHNAQPPSTVLDDGFSPPQRPGPVQSEGTPQPPCLVQDPALCAKSEF